MTLLPGDPRPDRSIAATSDERPIEKLLRVTCVLQGDRVAALRAEARGEYEQLRADQMWDEPVCSVCGLNHDRDESAGCEGASVISFSDWYGRASAFLQHVHGWTGQT